jgi:hypothetical protein
LHAVSLKGADDILVVDTDVGERLKDSRSLLVAASATVFAVS